jgi:hypothetical protein
MPTTARILSACLLAALAIGPGCGALGAEDAGAQHDGGSPHNDAGSGENCTCELTVYPEQPTVGTILSAKVDPLKGVSPFTYTWSAYGADGDPITVTPRNTELTQVDIPLESAGSYLIEVQQRTAYGYTCMAQKSLLVKNPTGKTEQVLFKFIPPASSGIPVQQQKLTITGGTPQGDLNLTLEQGILLALDVSDVVGATAPAFVRFVANDKGFETEAYLAAGASLDLNVLDDSYDVLVIPDESGTKRFAPTLSVNQALSTLTPPGSKLTLDPGVVVTGSVTAGIGDGVDGARVMLTKGRLPSTVGLADATGAFSVRVQSGSGFGVSVSPPEASGLPDLELADGVAIDAAGGQLTVAYDAAIQPVNDLAAEIRTNDSAKVVVGARVTLRGEIGTAGHVTIGATTLDAPGVVRRVATTDSSGVVSFASLPAGDYAIVVEPLGHGLTDDATTRAIVSLPTSQVTVPLFKKVTLSGTLERPGTDLTGSRVKAVLQVSGTVAPALGAAPTTIVQLSTGAFDVRIDPAEAVAPVQYALVADPPADSHLARAMRVVEVGGLVDIDLTPLALPGGLLLAGQVRPLYGVPVAGVYIEAHRYRAPGNEDPAARAETYTDDQGHFSLYFCDPDDME